MEQKSPINLPTDNNTIRKGAIEAQERRSGNPESKEQEEKDQKVSTTQDEQDGEKGLDSEDIPESTNESRGTMGSGQRQDSN